MQLSRSTAQHSALRRTAGPYIVARCVTAPYVRFQITREVEGRLNRAKHNEAQCEGLGTRAVIEIADVFRRFADGYLSAHGATILPSHSRAIANILVCRTEALGGHLWLASRWRLSLSLSTPTLVAELVRKYAIAGVLFFLVH